jgi:hypothetical protein
MEDNLRLQLQSSVAIQQQLEAGKSKLFIQKHLNRSQKEVELQQERHGRQIERLRQELAEEHHASKE